MKFNFCPQLENARQNHCLQVSIQRLIYLSVDRLRITQEVFITHQSIGPVVAYLVGIFLFLVDLFTRTQNSKTQNIKTLQSKRP